MVYWIYRAFISMNAKVQHISKSHKQNRKNLFFFLEKVYFSCNVLTINTYQIFTTRTNPPIHPTKNPSRIKYSIYIPVIATHKSLRKSKQQHISPKTSLQKCK